MKRTVPLLITAVGGFVLLFSFFFPATESWGENVMVWFDVLAAIAFVLGGGNLIKVHLQKISDRTRGWAYSAVTLIAFLVTLYVGLTKWGAEPAPNQEFFGETFAELPLAAFPDGQVASIPGEVPDRADHEPLHVSVQRQFAEVDAAGVPQLTFRGWMTADQRRELKGYEDTLEWQCAIERLFDEAQPPEGLRGKVAYYGDHEALAYRGYMTDDDRAALAELGENPRWKAAVDELYEKSRYETRVRYETLPERFSIPERLENVLSVDREQQQLVFLGPMPPAVRSALLRELPQYRIAKPLGEEPRAALLEEIVQRGQPLTELQLAAFHKVLDGVWTVGQLQTALDAAGEPQEVEKTACELLAEADAAREAGEVPDLELTRTVGEPTELSPEQLEVLEQFADDPDMTVPELSEALEAAGTFEDRQAAALDDFFSQVPPIPVRNRILWEQLVRADPDHDLAPEAQEFLLDGFRDFQEWQATVVSLFQQAHRTKYPWSGQYRHQGNPFWWIYEFIFKPLTATMFAMLAFYVASAAFRAFRAKNLEAMLLLGTAFIILLGRTFAGVYLTAWIPEEFAGLRIENLSMFIMQVFNTAGNRAIMIGIALGIASTSLKVLLGVDRSYLGSRD